MRMGWVKKKLKDVMTIERGGSPRPIEKYLTNKPDGINWIKISDATASNKYIYETKEKITVAGLSKSRLVKEGDFLLSNSMSFGRPYIMKTSGCIHDGWLVLRDKNVFKLDKEFLYYLLSSPLIFNQFDKLAAGSTVRNLNIALVSSVEIPIPPFSEQQRITAILNDALIDIDKVRLNVERNLQNTRELYVVYLQRFFANSTDDWKKSQLSSLIEKGWITSHLDGNHGSFYPRKEEFTKSGVPYISANCLDEDYVDMTRAKYLSPERAAVFSKGVAQNRDVLFAHNATVGPVALLQTNEKKVILSTSLTYYRCNPEHILPEYLVHYMRSKEFKSQYMAVMRQSTRNQVPITKQREFYHIIPPIEEQRLIVEKLENLSPSLKKLEAIYLKKLDKLDNLKKTLLQRAFTGELTSKTVEKEILEVV